MIRALAVRLAVLLCAGTVSADGHFQDLAEDAFGAAQIFDDYTHETAEDVLGGPIETLLPQSSMLPGDLEEAGIVAAGTDTTIGRSYGTFNDNLTDWSVAAFDQSNLDVADRVVADPDALIDPALFSTGGTQCSVTEFADAPRFTRVCDTSRNVVEASCTSRASITVIRTETYQCHVTPTGPVCDDLAASDFCAVTDQRCEFSDIDGNCVEQVADYTCSSDAEMSFEAPQTGVTSWATPIITWAQTCDAAYNPQACDNPVTSCTSGSSVEDVNGLLVPMDCTVEQTVSQCAGSDFASGCALFESDASCSLTNAECISEGPDGNCGTFENTYECGSDEATAFDAQCDAVNVCVAGVCQSVPQERDKNIGKSLASIDLLNTMSNELALDPRWQNSLCPHCIPTSAVTFFSARDRSCRKTILGALNCCSDTGWANGTFDQCRTSEMELAAARNAGSTVYLETRCTRRRFFICVRKSRFYCVYNSRIAREISLQGQRQLTGGFSCRGLSQAELERIDWNRINLSRVFGDMFNNIEGGSTADLTSIIQNNILLASPEVQEGYE